MKRPIRTLGGAAIALALISSGFASTEAFARKRGKNKMITIDENGRPNRTAPAPDSASELSVVNNGPGQMANAKPKKKGGKMIIFWSLATVAVVGGIVAASGGSNRAKSP